jgi:hypothetical protein
MKFVEKCFVLADDVTRLKNQELCAAITYQSIEKHLYLGHIHFSFIIKKNSKESWNVGKPVEVMKVDSTRPKQTTHSVPNKGSLRGNNVRKGQSVPDVKLSGGGVLKKETISVEIDETKAAKTQPPDYSSINKFDNKRHFASPAHCTEAMKRNDDEIVSKFDFYLNLVKKAVLLPPPSSSFIADSVEYGEDR